MDVVDSRKAMCCWPPQEKFRFDVDSDPRLAEEVLRLAGHVWSPSQVCLYDPCTRRPIGGPLSLVTHRLLVPTCCPATLTDKATKACDIPQVLPQGSSHMPSEVDRTGGGKALDVDRDFGSSANLEKTAMHPHRC